MATKFSQTSHITNFFHIQIQVWSKYFRFLYRRGFLRQILYFRHIVYLHVNINIHLFLKNTCFCMFYQFLFIIAVSKYVFRTPMWTSYCKLIVLSGIKKKRITCIILSDFLVLFFSCSSHWFHWPILSYKHLEKRGIYDQQTLLVFIEVEVKWRAVWRKVLPMCLKCISVKIYILK